MPAGPRGVVTRAEGRELIEIDHQPAAEVYVARTGGILSSVTPGEFILRQTTLFRWRVKRAILVACPITAVPSANCYRTSLVTSIYRHPRRRRSSDARQSFRIARDTKVVRSTEQASEPELMGTVAALNIFCAGCMLTIHPDMKQIVDCLQAAREWVFCFISSLHVW